MKGIKILLGLLLISPFAGLAQTEEEYISKGLDLEEEGRFATAILYYDSALMLNDQNAIAYYNRGACYAALKKYGAALVDYNKALFIDTSLADAYYNRGLIHYAMNNPVLARADIEYYTQLQPGDTLGFLALADILFKQGDFAPAIAANQKLINLGLERKAVALKNQGVCYYKLETLSMAEYLLTQAILHSPSYDDAYLERARVRTDMELYKDALDDLHDFMLRNPSHIEGLSIRSACNFNLKRFDYALQDFEKLISLQPAKWEWYFEKGNCLVKLKRDEEAEEAYSIALKNATSTGWILVMRGIVRYNQKKKEEACFDWHQARLLGEEEAILLYSRYCE